MAPVQCGIHGVDIPRDHHGLNKAALSGARASHRESRTTGVGVRVHACCAEATTLTAASFDSQLQPDSDDDSMPILDSTRLTKVTVYPHAMPYMSVGWAGMVF